MEQPDDNDHDEHKDQEGDGQSDVEREIRGLKPGPTTTTPWNRGRGRILLRVDHDGQVVTGGRQLGPAQAARAVLARDVLALAVAAPVGRSRGRTAAASHVNAVRGTGTPRGPVTPGAIH